MRAVIQRVSEAKVSIGGKRHSSIEKGLLVLLGVEKGDSINEARAMARKTAELRVFEDSTGKMNLSVLDVGGEILVVSQFTILGDCRKGRRPSFLNAANPPEARRLYELYAEAVASHGIHVSKGVFQEMMEVELTNDGPVTILLDSRKNF